MCRRGVSSNSSGSSNGPVFSEHSKNSKNSHSSNGSRRSNPDEDQTLKATGFYPGAGAGNDDDGDTKSVASGGLSGGSPDERDAVADVQHLTSCRRIAFFGGLGFVGRQGFFFMDAAAQSVGLMSNQSSEAELVKKAVQRFLFK